MSLFRRRPVAPVTPVATDLSSGPVGRGRRWLVPALLFAATLAAAAGGACWLTIAADPAHLAPESRQPLADLQTLLPGQPIDVPAGAGFWAWQLGRADLMLLRARLDGDAQRIDLCAQRMSPRGDPALIYPIALSGGLPLPTNAFAKRNPVVIDPASARGLPAVWLEGRAFDDPAAHELTLRVADRPSAAVAKWQVALATRLPPWPAGSQRAAAHAAGAAGGASFRLQQQAWLLWTPAGDAAKSAVAAANTAANTAAGAKASSAATGSATQRHTHALRLRVLPQAGCAAGAVEWQLFSTRGLSDAEQNAAATLVVQPTARSNHGEPARATTDEPIRVRLRAGPHTVPSAALPRLEDGELFDRAWAVGLLQALPDGRVAVVAPDALRAQATPMAGSTAASTPALDDAAGPLIKALHRSANGAFVRDQLAQANQARYWLALRVSSFGEGPPAVLSPMSTWQARWQGELLRLDDHMPAVTMRLFNKPMVGWSDWARVMAPQTWLRPPLPSSVQSPLPADAPVQLTLPVRPDAGASPMVRLMLLGRLLGVQGASVVDDAPGCLGPGCAQPDMLRQVVLRVQPGALAITLTLQPQPLFNRLNPAATEQSRVQWRGKQLQWIDPPEGGHPRYHPAEVRVAARDGSTLYANGQPTPLADTLGLLPLVGLGPEHGHSMAGMLGRLGAVGQASVDARSTLEPRYQRLLGQVLACVGQADGRWRPDTESCALPAQQPWQDKRRVTAAVVMDARLGDVLASASGAALPQGLSLRELLEFDAFNPGNSPLRLPALQHDGGAAHAPGSTFKLAGAMGLELAAQQSPKLIAALQGLAPGQLDALAGSWGKPFEMASGCYPAPCAAHTTQVQNFKGVPALQQVADGRFGLVQALQKSVNTWFALMAEATDATVQAGHPDARPLGASAMIAERPTLAVLTRLGLLETQPLDSGLLPAGFAWQPGDVLRASAGHLDPITDLHGVLQQALGLRMQTTPLQMARLSAAAATGTAPVPRLLLEINGQTGTVLPGMPVQVSLERIRQGMAAVVQSGTAAGAFGSAAIKPIKGFVFGKTGSAPLASNDKAVQCSQTPHSAPSPLACLNNAWFVGYLLPGALPGETRTLAFAVQISHTRVTGGGHAAPVIAGWLETVWRRHAAEASAKPAAGAAATVVP